jgi:hypothetical protein
MRQRLPIHYNASSKRWFYSIGKSAALSKTGAIEEAHRLRRTQLAEQSSVCRFM